MFTVNGSFQLQSSGPSAADTAYLTTAFNPNFSDTVVWEFYWRMAFSPSDNNKSRVYLMSSAANLNGALNGYFVQLGENLSNDNVDLFRQDGNTITSIISGVSIYSSNPSIVVRVTRFPNSNWQLESRLSGAGSFTAEGTTSDNTYSSSQHFGVWCKYTSSNSGAFYFDDFYIDSVITIPPTLESMMVNSATEIELTFSEPMDPASSQIATNYSLDNGVGNPISATLSGGNLVTLQLPSAMVSETTYTLSVSGVKDAEGIAIVPVDTSFFFIDFATGISFRDIVINEIMADPTPQVGLPDGEFVEIHNTTANYYSLDQAVFHDGTGNFSFPSGHYIAPGEYIVLCDDSDSAALAAYGKVIAFTSFPALTNGGEALSFELNGTIVDQVNYSDTWYLDALKADGGYTLEQINPLAVCTGPSNWIACSDTMVGGTPGQQNSVYSIAPDATPPTIESVSINTLNEVQVKFSEVMDSTSLAQGTYSLTNGVSVNGITVSELTTVILNLLPNLDSSVIYTLTVDGVTDCPGNVIQEKTIDFGIGALPAPNDLVINELYPDPDEAAGIPPFEFVELHNRSGKLLRLENLELADARKSSVIATTVMMPDEYLILCSSGSAALFAAYGKVATVSSMPSLNNTGDSIYIHLNGTTIDLVEYSDSWYQDENKQDGGFTLERINPEISCTQESNWRASNDGLGGTPGMQNSIYSLAPDTTNPIISALEVVAIDTLRLMFSKPMDSASLTAATFSAMNGLTVSKVMPIAPFFKEVVLVLSPALDSGVLYQLIVTGGTDCLGNPLVSDSMQIAIGLSAKPYDLVINEISPVPSEAQTIPPYEFIEIYNRTDNLLSLDGLRIADRSSSSAIQGEFILPHEYVIVCDDGYDTLFRPFGRVTPVSSMPSLNNSDDAIAIMNGATTIDVVAYFDTWYGDDDLIDAGLTLERVNPNDICGLGSNWKASTSANGGTPGQVNSVYSATSVGNPKLVAAQFISPTTIQVEFDRKMDSTAMAELSITANASLLTNGEINESYFSITASSASSFQRGMAYSIMIDSVSDCVGLSLQNASIELYLHDTGDIVINEVLFNPRESGSDFVELFNNSNYDIALNGWSLAYYDSKDSLRFNEISAATLTIPSKGFIALNEDDNNILLNYSMAVEDNLWVMNLPSYSNDEGSVLLYDQLEEPMERFDYNEGMHFALIDNPDGVSLERLDPSRPASDVGNWHSASSDVNYATPGYANSQQYASSATSAFSLSAEYISPDLDGYQDVVNIDYTLAKPGTVATVKVYTDKGVLIRELASNLILGTTGTITWDGTNDNGEKARTGIHVILVETFDLAGNRGLIRLPVVVALKL
ncbi:MAG: lamin tail domain-containing protein [Flavobacteriales bacterium]